MKVVLVTALLGIFSYCFASLQYQTFQQSPPVEDIGGTWMERGSKRYKLYHNLWYHNGKFFAMIGPKEKPRYIEEGLTVNHGIVQFPLTDVEKHLQNLQRYWIPGVTLMIDFPFPAYPENLGHWAEVMFPTYGVLRQGNWTKQSKYSYVNTMLLTNLNKGSLPDWFKQTIAVATAPGAGIGRQHPLLIDMNDISAASQQGYVGFESVLVVQDRYTHPDRLQGFPNTGHGDAWRQQGCERFIDEKVDGGFATEDDAAAFRFAMYKRMNFTPPEQRLKDKKPAIPRTITLLTINKGETVVNRDEVLDALWSVEEKLGWTVRPASLATTSNMVAHMAMAARTGILVARHGPLLASSLYLAPGAAVVELLPYNWEWRNISQLYRNISHSTGHLYHFQWRADDAKWAVYDQDSDSRYSEWSASECTNKECLNVHAKAGLKVNVDALKAMLLKAIPLVEKQLGNDVTEEAVYEALNAVRNGKDWETAAGWKNTTEPDKNDSEDLKVELKKK